jgi:hypothetical protein
VVDDEVRADRPLDTQHVHGLQIAEIVSTAAGLQPGMRDPSRVQPEQQPAQAVPAGAFLPARVEGSGHHYQVQSRKTGNDSDCLGSVGGLFVSPVEPAGGPAELGDCGAGIDQFGVVEAGRREQVHRGSDPHRLVDVRRPGHPSTLRRHRRAVRVVNAACG